MTSLVNKEIEAWLDKVDAMTVDPLGRFVIEDKSVLEMISGGYFYAENNGWDTL